MRCASCSRRLRGVFFEAEGAGLCRACVTCPYCLERGCISCAESRVEDASAARPLYVAAQEFLAEHGMEVVRPPLHVSDTLPFALRVRRYSGQAALEAGNVKGFFTPSWPGAGTGGIWLRSGTPAPLASAWLAHELVHAWQAEHCPAQAPVLREGLAVWAEHRALLAQGLRKRARLLVRRACPTYGRGLRLCLAWEGLVGAEAMVAAVRTCSDFPWWLRALTWLGV